MNKSNERVMLESLLHIAQCVEDGTVEKDCGICDSLKMYVYPYDYYPIMLLLEELSTKWIKYSGNPSYPVPYNGVDAGDAYRSVSLAGGLWDTDTQYGIDRIELLHFLINKLQNMPQNPPTE